MRKLLTGNAAAAWGARLAEVDYVPAFPITPQTEIIELIAEWMDKGAMTGRTLTLESEHSMITAAGAAASTGVRTFTATSSQGLLYGMEMIYTVAGWRAPFVLVNVSRALASPITLEPDHSDVLAARDSGFIQIHCSTCQEVLDFVLLAYRLAEDERVRLPVIVNLDGFYLSFTREPVDIPDKETVSRFLPAFNPGELHFRAGDPVSQGVVVLGGSQYSYFRYEIHMAVLNALPVWEVICREYEFLTGRSYGPVETYRTEDADIVYFMIGSFATKAKDAVDRLRKIGWKIGLVRPRLLRPFPREPLIDALRNIKGIAVIDQNLSIGKGGVLHSELCSVLYHSIGNLPQVLSFIGGLGGRDIAVEEFYEIAAVTAGAVATGITPPPRLLYTEEEFLQMRGLQSIARVGRK